MAAQEGVGHWAIVPGVCGIERIVSLQPHMALWYLCYIQGTMTASTYPWLQGICDVHLAAMHDMPIAPPAHRSPVLLEGCEFPYPVMFSVVHMPSRLKA